MRKEQGEKKDLLCSSLLPLMLPTSQGVSPRGRTVPCEGLLSAQTGASDFLFYPRTSNPRSLPRVIMSLQRLGTKHMTSTACWVAGEERGIVIVEKEASSDHVSTLNQPPPKNQTAQNHPSSWGKPEDQKKIRGMWCVSSQIWESSPPALQYPSQLYCNI